MNVGRFVGVNTFVCLKLGGGMFLSGALFRHGTSPSYRDFFYHIPKQCQKTKRGTLGKRRHRSRQSMRDAINSSHSMSAGHSQRHFFYDGLGPAEKKEPLVKTCRSSTKKTSSINTRDSTRKKSHRDGGRNFLESCGSRGVLLDGGGGRDVEEVEEAFPRQHHQSARVQSITEHAHSSVRRVAQYTERSKNVVGYSRSMPSRTTYTSHTTVKLNLNYAPPMSADQEGTAGRRKPNTRAYGGSL